MFFSHGSNNARGVAILFRSGFDINIDAVKRDGQGRLWQDFRTGPYFIMHTLLCFKKTIAITIDVLWDCGALFFLFRGFFSKSIWT